MLVPTVGLLAFGGHSAYRASAEADRAQEVEARVDRAGVLLRLKLLLTNETFSTGGVATAARFGLAPDAMEPLVGFDPVVRMRDDRRAVDRLAASGAGIDELAGPYRRLVATRRALDTGRLGLDQLLADYSDVHARLTDAAVSALERADAAARQVGQSARLRGATSTLQATVDAATAVGVQLDGLAQLLTPSSPANRTGPLEQLRVGLAVSRQADLTLDRLLRGELRRAWRQALGSDAAAVLDTEANRYAALAPSEIPALDFDGLIRLFAEGMRHLDAVNAIAEQAAAETVEEAEALHERAERELRVAVAAVLAVALLSVGVTALTSRSIAGPIRSVALRAGRVTAGDLGDGIPGRHGFRELSEVSTAFEELVENLRVVEAQVAALAAGVVDDPVLEVPVPGRLGTLLHDSVQRLSRSISERELLAHRLEHDATHDPLTGAANRASFLDALGLALIGRTTDLAVLKLDLDGFKAVNETHGHDAGDRVLRVTVERLRADIGPDGLVARIGGDEFGVILTGAAAGDAEAVAARLSAHVAAPMSVGAIVLQVRASAGVAVADGTTDARGLFRQVRLAARAAKCSGGGGIARFDAAMLAEVERQTDIEHRLRHAIVDGELLLHFQPVVDEHLRTVSVEALVRWRSSDGALVPPGDFIPVAEASDLVLDLGRWVLDEACRVLAGWRDDPSRRHLRLSVNLSGRHVMSMNVVDDVRAALHRFGVPPDRLAIEVTETVLLSDLAVATEHLGRLRELGVHIAVDDFGTGYTSLAHLRQLPVDLIKIDRSLVVAAAERAADARIVELVVGAAHASGMAVIAEGVETNQQMAAIRLAGCDYVQGFLTGRPGPEPVPAGQSLEATRS